MLNGLISGLGYKRYVEGETGNDDNDTGGTTLPPLTGDDRLTINDNDSEESNSESSSASAANINSMTDREFDVWQTGEARDWYENLSNTAYQRAVSDMKQAGLNPALMFGSGTSASSAYSSGATSTTEQTNSKNNTTLLVTGINSAVKLLSSFSNILSAII